MEKTIYSERNIAMMMDLYEMTMANGYFENGDRDTVVAFDVFYRKIRITAALLFSQGWS